MFKGLTSDTSAHWRQEFTPEKPPSPDQPMPVEDDSDAEKKPMFDDDLGCVLPKSLHVTEPAGMTAPPPPKTNLLGAKAKAKSKHAKTTKRKASKVAETKKKAAPKSKSEKSNARAKVSAKKPVAKGKAKAVCREKDEVWKKLHSAPRLFYWF